MTGWPFLVARGRRRGYSVLLAPDFLVAAGAYGFLEDVVGPTRPDAPVRVASARAPDGRPVRLVWAEHRVTARDLGGAGEDPVDEHSRPLDLLHGVLVAGRRVDGVARTDLDRSLAAALDAYRRFLADEEGFAVVGSAAFDAAPTVAAAPAAPVQSAPPAPPAQSAPAPVRERRIAVPLVVSGVAVLLALRWLGAGDPPPPPPMTCTSVATTTSPTTPPRPSSVAGTPSAPVTSPSPSVAGPPSTSATCVPAE